jgi:hypothetical protein
MEHCFSLSVTREVAFVCELGVTEWQKNSVSPAKCLGAKERQKRAVEVDEGAGTQRIDGATEGDLYKKPV